MQILPQMPYLAQENLYFCLENAPCSANTAMECFCLTAYYMTTLKF